MYCISCRNSSGVHHSFRQSLPQTSNEQEPKWELAAACHHQQDFAWCLQLRSSRRLSVLARLVLDDLPEVTAETAPVEPLAPRRMHRRRDKGVHQASAVPSFELLRLPEYRTGLVVGEGYRDGPGGLLFFTVQSVESEITRSKPSCDQTFLKPRAIKRS